MFKLNSFLLYSEKPEELAAFYKKVLQEDPKWEEGGYSGFDIDGFVLVIGLHDKVHGKNKSPERLIFNFETKDVEKEFERLKDIGATVIKEPYRPGEENSMTIATLADPDGNYFQLATPME